MAIINYEFKARVQNLLQLEEKLLALNPLFKGEDHQIDTYFNVTKGRLKLREGNIENALIYYERENTKAARQSNVLLYQHQPDAQLKAILVKVNGIKIIVDKQRKIYFVDNVKIHFDKVEGLGTFVEVEAIDTKGSIAIEKLKEQCNYFAALFGIAGSDYIALSYSDMMLENKVVMDRH